MKKSVFLFFMMICSSFLFLSCKEEVKKEALYTASETATTQAPEQLGQEIFEGKGNCVSCHQPDVKIIGPSIREIAKMYKDKNASIVTFLKGDGEPIVDPSQYEVMKANFAITKNMSDEELQALEAYFYSNLK